MFRRKLTATFAALCITGLCWMALFSPYLAAQQPADVILHNGKILTVDNNFSTAQAIAIRGTRIAALGQDQQILALRGPSTRVLDLKGRTVIPGIIDSHEHVYAGSESAYGGELDYRAFMLYPIDWSGVRSTQDVLNQVSAFVSKYQFRPGEWIHFASRGQNTPEGVKIMTDGLTRSDLDKVTPNNPIVMAMNWPAINGLLANTKAIDAVWAEHGDFVKKYGRYWIDSAGQPDGHMESPATWLFLEHLPKPTPEVLAPLYTKFSQELNAQGITAVSTWMVPYAIAGYKLLEASGEALIRIGYGVERGFLPSNVDLTKGLTDYAAMIGSGSEKFWITSVSTGAIDGAGTRICSGQPRLQPFSVLDQWWPAGQCLQDIEYRGGKGAPITGNYFREWLLVMARDGVRLANEHTSGDRSVKMLLNTLQEEQQRRGPTWKPGNGRGWGMDHCVLVDPADLPRAAKLNIMFSCGVHIGGDEYARSYGDKVANTFPAPLKSMFNNGLVATIETPGFDSVELAITRKDDKGKVWGGQERLTRGEALRAITIMPAHYFLKADQVGSLEVGKLADLVVLDKDYMTMPEDNISDLVPQLTMLDGRIVFAHSQFAQEYSLTGQGTTISTLEDLRKRRKPGMSRR